MQVELSFMCLHFPVCGMMKCWIMFHDAVWHVGGTAWLYVPSCYQGNDVRSITPDSHRWGQPTNGRHTIHLILGWVFIMFCKNWPTWFAYISQSKGVTESKSHGKAENNMTEN